MSVMPSETSTQVTRSRSRPARGWPATVRLLAVAWAALCGLMVGLGWLLTHPLTRSVGTMDNDLAQWFARQRNPTLSDLAAVGTLLGETVTGLVVLFLVALGFSLRQHSRIPALFVTVVYAGLGGIYLVATHLIPRQRPPVTILDKGLVPDHSFPSGHVGTATAVVGCIIVLTWTYAWTARWWTMPLLVVPLGTLLARMYQGAHHLTDVLAGLFCATIWLGTVATLVLRDRSDRDRSGQRTGRAGRSGQERMTG